MTPMVADVPPLERGLRRAATRWPVETVAGGAAAAAVVAMAAMRLVVNAPVALPAAVSSGYGLVDALALAVPAVAALVLGLAAADPLERIGLVSVGVFGGLAVVTPGAEVPAAGAIVAGGGLAVAARLQARSWARPPVLVAGAVLAAAVLALGSATGLAGSPARAVGSGLALVGLAAAPALVPPSRPSWVLGAFAFVAVVAAGTAAPFITGAVTLVAFAAVGVPLLLIALGAAGGVTAAASAVLAGRHAAAFGAVCLLAAGVPATVPRALAAVLGLVLLVDARGSP